MQKSILIGPSSFGDIDQTGVSKIKDAGYQIIENPFKRKITKEELIKLLSKDVIGLIAGLETLDEEVLNKSHLKAISRLGSGISNIDLTALKNKNIKLSYIPEGPTQSVAELTVANIINLARKTVQMDKELKDNQNWHRLYGNEINEKCVLIIGFGKIGQKVWKILTAIGANVIICDPFVNNSSSFNVDFYKLEDALPIADIITIHASGDKEIISKNEIELTKKGVILCNSSRGQVLNENDLISALDSGKISSAWIDAFIEEPYKGKLLNYSQCIFTPHISSLTVECRSRMEKIAVENIINDLR